MQMIYIWINCDTELLADQIAEELLEARLIAAANRYPSITSRYRWEGELHTRDEVPLLLKTRAELFSRVKEEVFILHPFKTPSVQAQQVADVDPQYLAWVYEQTQDA